MPDWSVAALVVAAMWWVGFLVALMRTQELSAERRFYWLGHAGAAALVAVGFAYLGWKSAVGAAALVAMQSTLYAALKTPYLKIGGRLISASDSDRRRDEKDRGLPPRPPKPDDYGTSSAAKAWWILAFVSMMAAAVVLRPDGDDSRSHLGLVLMVVVAGMFGHIDGRARMPVARGKYVPAALAALASIALYAIPVVFYFAGYFVGTKLPVSYGRHHANAVHQRDALPPQRSDLRPGHEGGSP